MSDTINDDGEQLATKDDINYLSKKSHVRLSVVIGFVSLVGCVVIGTLAEVNSNPQFWVMAYFLYATTGFMLFHGIAHFNRGYAHHLWQMTFGRADAFYIETTVSDYE